MRKTGIKRLALCAMLGAILLAATGCVIKPDPTTVETTGDVVLLPFATATPTPTAAPTNAMQTWGGDSSQATNAPPTYQPIAVITPQATAKPAYTIKPIATTGTAAVTVAPGGFATVAPTEDTTLRSGSSGVGSAAAPPRRMSLPSIRSGRRNGGLTKA